MAWHSTSPLGTVSVKANRIIQQDNTTYIETTMGNSVAGSNTNTTRDHYWNVGANEDGRHRFVQSQGFTVGGTPTDPVIGTGMDGVQYLKSDGLTPSRIQGFFRNAQGVYQSIPAFISGSIAVGSSFVTIATLPTNVYGEIYMYTATHDRRSGVVGFFKTVSGTCDAWSYGLRIQGSGTAGFALKFGNGSDSSGLDLRVATEDAANGLVWFYKIVYRAI